MKKFTFLLFCLAVIQIVNAQTGSISGRITTKEGDPVINVTVIIKGSLIGTSSKDDGSFHFKKVNPGNYTLVMSFTGLKTEERKLTVVANRNTELNVTLTESTSELKAVFIDSHRPQNDRTLYSSKAAISNMDLPQTVGAVSSTVIADQQATRVGDVVRNISGVSLTQTRLGVNETYTARGYSIGVNGVAGSVFKNGLISNIAGMPEAATLESVEVMKGSSALLYGNVSGGLIMNLVTKKPKFEYGGEIKLQAGSFSAYKPIVDMYGPISKQLAFRIVGTYENDKSFRDIVKTKRVYVNPSLLYKLGKKTTILFQGDHLNAKLTPDFGIGTLDSGRILPTTIPRSRFINVLWAYNNVEQSSASLQADHAFNDSWKLSLGTSLQSTDVDSYGAANPTTVKKNGDWNRTLARAHTDETDATIQLNLNGKFSTGKIAHQLLVGGDFTRVIIKTDAFRITSNGVVVNTYDKINILDPSLYTKRNDIPDAATTTTTKAPSNRTGVYVQDLVSLTHKIKLLAGLRWSEQETFQTRILTTSTQATTLGTVLTKKDNALSPKFALLYQPKKTRTFFVSYSNNFTINTGTDIYGQVLKPSIIDQYEAGVKNNFFNGKLSANFSIYRILNNNLAQQAEFKADGTPNSDATVKTLSGQTTSDGLELELNGNLCSNFYFIAGYGYNQMYFTNTTNSKGSNIEGERVVINPAHTANLAAFYTFTKKAVKGLKVGVAGYYIGDRLGGYNNLIGQTQIGSRLLPLTGFATVDLTAGYGIGKFSLMCKLSNVFDTKNYLVHDNYSIAPVTPRNFTATLGYKFRGN